VLIVLSGVETINKKLISLLMFSTLNKKIVGDYESTYRNGFLQILKGEETVYSPLYYTENYEELSEKLDETTGLFLSNDLIKHDLIEKLDQETLKIFLDYDFELQDIIVNNHHRNWFTSIEKDLGIRDYSEFELFDESWKEIDSKYVPRKVISYEELLNRYREKKYEYQIISGSFGKSFLEKIRGDLGEQNVFVLNIVRNPSSSFIINNKPEISYEQSLNQSDNRLTKKDDELVFIESYMNSIIIKDLPYVNTIKYEDILKTGHIDINGNIIDLSEFYKKYNNYITVFDIKKIISLELVNSTILNGYNMILQNLPLSYVNSFNDNEEGKPTIDDDLTEEQFEKVPKNFFEPFGYSPLSYEQVTNINS
jgi:hypothetical protein